MKKVAVVGGGITGLVAAFRLSRQGGEGIAPSVFEASERVGGVIQSTLQDGFLAESGPNTIVDDGSVVGGLLSDLKLEDCALASDPSAEKKFLIRNGKPIAVPGTPPAFLKSPLFTLSGKLRLLWEPFIRKRNESAEEESVADFARRRVGQEILDYAINPLVAGIYAGNPQRLSMRHAFPRIYDLEQAYGSLIRGQIQLAKERKESGQPSRDQMPKLSFDRGMEVLPRTIASELDSSIFYKSPISRIRRETSGGWSIQVANSEGWQFFDALVLALPSFALSRILFENTAEPSLQELDQVPYPPVVSVTLGYRREDVSHPLDGFGALVPEREDRDILGTIFSSSLFPGRAPEGHVTLASYLGGARSPDLASLGEEELVALCHKDLRDLFGCVGEPSFQHCHIHTRAIAQYEIGFGKIQQLLDDWERTEAGLFFAGACRDGISLPDSILSATKTASRVEEFLTKES